MWNDNSCYKRITFNAVYILILMLLLSCFLSPTKNDCIAHAAAENLEEEIQDNVDDILGEIDTDEFDYYVTNDFNFDFFKVDSFKNLVAKVLTGEFFSEYDSLLEFFSSSFLESFKQIFSFALTIFAMVVLFEIFSNLCADKYSDLKKSVKFIFSIIIALSLLVVVKNVSESLKGVISSIFSFSNILFPVLLGLVLSAGATSTFSVYSSLSVFILNTAMYVFNFVLLPLAVVILTLSLFNMITSKDRFSKLVNLLKYIFKVIVTVIFSVFGLFSILNIATSGMKDGVSLKLTKYAIKNYIPILGGYISDGFDFVKTCSVMVKNAFGVCGIFVLLFMVIKPIILYVVYIVAFKILSVLTSFIGGGNYATIFEDVSKGFSFLLAVLVGVFLIMLVFIFLMISSVSVV